MIGPLLGPVGRRASALAIGGALALLAGSASTVRWCGAASASGDAAVLRRALEASTRARFGGTILVRWLDGSGVVHQSSLPATGEGASLLLGAPVAGAPTSSSSKPKPMGWTAAARTAAKLPDVSLTYDIRVQQGPTVVGRATQRVLLSRRAVVVEELDTDVDTGLVLKRRSFDPDGRTRRTVEFTALDHLWLGPPPAAADPGKAAPESSPPSWAGLPTSLGAGLQRLDVHRHGSVVQGVYGDGLRTLSVFVQPGAVDAEALPDDGVAVPIRRWPALRWTWAGGQVVTWSDGRATTTVVGDGSEAEVLAAATAVQAGRPTLRSAMDQLKLRCREVVELLA